MIQGEELNAQWREFNGSSSVPRRRPPAISAGRKRYTPVSDGETRHDVPEAWRAPSQTRPTGLPAGRRWGDRIDANASSSPFASALAWTPPRSEANPAISEVPLPQSAQRRHEPAATKLEPEQPLSAVDYAARLEVFRSRGLKFFVHLHRGAMAMVEPGPRSAREVTAAAFNISEGAVSKGHLERMAWAHESDPALLQAFLSDEGQATIPAGTTVSMSGTMRGLESADAGLRAAIATLTGPSAGGGQPPAAEAGATGSLFTPFVHQLGALLMAVRRRKSVVRLEMLLQHAAQQANRGASLQEVEDAFKGPSSHQLSPIKGWVEKRPADALAVGVAGRIETLGRTSDLDARGEAALLAIRLERMRAAALRVYASRALNRGSLYEARSALDRALSSIGRLEDVSRDPKEQASLRMERAKLHQAIALTHAAEAQRRFQKQPPPRSVVSAARFVRDGTTNPENAHYRFAVSRSFDRAIELHQADANRVRDLKMERASVLADIDAITAGSQTSTDLLRGLVAALPQHEEKIVRSVRPGPDSKAGANPAMALGEIARDFEGLPPAAQDGALALAVRLGERLAAEQDQLGLKAIRAMIGALAGSPDAIRRKGLALRIEALDGQAHLLAGRFARARSKFRSLWREARALPSSDPKRTSFVEKWAVFEARALVAMAMAKPNRPLSHLHELRELRRSLTSTGNLSEHVSAALLVLEAEAGVTLDETGFANKAYSLLKQDYAHVPAVSQVLDGMKAHKTDGASAFVKVALAQWNKSSFGESSATVGCGMAIGAAFGVPLLGIGALPGAALGATFGATLGGIGLGSYNLFGRGGLARAIEATESKLAAHSRLETAVNAAGAALDFMPIPAAIQAARHVGRPMREILVRGVRATSPEAVELLSDLEAVVRRVAADHRTSVSAQQTKRLVKEIPVKRAASAFFQFGGRAPTLVLASATLTTFAARAHEIETTISSPREQDEAYRALVGQLGKAVLSLGVFAPAGVVNYLALNPVGPQAGLRRVLAELATSPMARLTSPDVRILHPAEVTRYVDKILDELEVKGTDRRKATRALSAAFDTAYRNIAPFITEVSQRILTDLKADMTRNSDARVVFVGRDGMSMAHAISALDPAFFRKHASVVTLSRVVVESALQDVEATGRTFVHLESFRRVRAKVDRSSVPGAKRRLDRYLAEQQIPLAHGEVILVDSSFKGTIQELLSALYPTVRYQGRYLFLGTSPRDPHPGSKRGYVVEVDTPTPDQVLSSPITRTFAHQDAIGVIEELLHGGLGSPTHLGPYGPVQIPQSRERDPLGGLNPIAVSSHFKDPITREGVKRLMHVAVDLHARNVAASVRGGFDPHARLQRKNRELHQAVRNWIEGRPTEPAFRELLDSFVRRTDKEEVKRLSAALHRQSPALSPRQVDRVWKQYVRLRSAEEKRRFVKQFETEDF